MTAPSTHFARRLEEHGVFRPVDVIWNGIDDEVREATLSGAPSRARRRVGRRLVWLGRMSPEKRLLPFLEAVVASGVDADVEIIGGGGAACRPPEDRRRPTRASGSPAGSVCRDPRAHRRGGRRRADLASASRRRA